MMFLIVESGLEVGTEGGTIFCNYLCQIPTVPTIPTLKEGIVVYIGNPLKAGWWFLFFPRAKIFKKRSEKWECRHNGVFITFFFR